MLGLLLYILWGITIVSLVGLLKLFTSNFDNDNDNIYSEKKNK